MKINLDNIDSIGEIDLFICSSGFESRSTIISSSINTSLIKDSIIFHIIETYETSVNNLGKIRNNLGLSDDSIKLYPKNSSLKTFDILYSSIKEKISLSGKQNLTILIDITTFTREVLLILLKALSLFKNIRIKTAYVPNEKYSIEEKEIWMTKGIRDIRSILGFSGLHTPNKKLLLIILNGFEEERTENIIDSFEPAGIILGKPEKADSINDNLNRISCDKFQYIKNKYDDLINEEFEFSCINIIKTKKVLEDLIKKYNEYNIIISPLNNKISTLAVGVVGINNEEVQVCYASANQYNIDAKAKSSDYLLSFDIEFEPA